MSIQLVGQVIDLRDSGMKPPVKLVLLLLANRADEHGECWPTQKRLALEANMSERSIRDHLKALEDAGYIDRDTKRLGHGMGSDTTYRFRPEKFAGLSYTGEGSPIKTGEGSPIRNRQEPSSSETSSPRGARKRASQIGDYALGEKELEYAFSKGMTEEQARHEFEKFHNHFTGTGGTKKDWLATWRNWVIRSLEITRGGNPNRRPTQSDEAFERVKGQILQSERVAAQEAQRAANQREQTLLDFDTEIPL